MTFLYYLFNKLFDSFSIIFCNFDINFFFSIPGNISERIDTLIVPGPLTLKLNQNFPEFRAIGTTGIFK